MRSLGLTCSTRPPLGGAVEALATSGSGSDFRAAFAADSVRPVPVRYGIALITSSNDAVSIGGVREDDDAATADAGREPPAAYSACF